MKISFDIICNKSLILYQNVDTKYKSHGTVARHRRVLSHRLQATVKIGKQNAIKRRAIPCNYRLLRNKVNKN